MKGWNDEGCRGSYLRHRPKRRDHRENYYTKLPSVAQCGARADGVVPPFKAYFVRHSHRHSPRRLWLHNVKFAEPSHGIKLSLRVRAMDFPNTVPYIVPVRRRHTPPRNQCGVIQEVLWQTPVQARRWQKRLHGEGGWKNGVGRDRQQVPYPFLSFPVLPLFFSVFFSASVFNVFSRYLFFILYMLPIYTQFKPYSYTCHYGRVV